MKKVSRAEQDLQDFETVFWAVAHASRRQILVVLNSRGGSLPAGDIAKRFACSWPTVTRHLKVLEQASLVSVRKQGRENIYELNTARLNKIREWMDYFKKDYRDV